MIVDASLHAPRDTPPPVLRITWMCLSIGVSGARCIALVGLLFSIRPARQFSPPALDDLKRRSNDPRLRINDSTPSDQHPRLQINDSTLRIVDLTLQIIRAKPQIVDSRLWFY
jgi:hypothetical protein